MAPSGHSPCASCKLLRRRCAKDCIFAPYFPSEEPHKFAIVHKVFGASNVSKMLQELPVHQRADAVSSLVYEANARTRDPVYGCVGAISYLQKQVSQLQMQLAVAQAEMLCIGQMNQEPPPPHQAEPPAPAASSYHGLQVPPPVVHHPMMLSDHDMHVISSSSSSRAASTVEDMLSYSCLHNITNHQYFNFSSNNVIQYDNLKRESSFLWT